MSVYKGNKNRASMITDPEQIAHARAVITAHRRSYLSLSLRDFEKTCPEPDCLIHVTGSDAGDVLEQLQEEYTQLPARKVRGIVAFISSRVLTMRGLSAIIASFPSAKRMKGGLGFGRPKGCSVEIYLFVGLG